MQELIEMFNYPFFVNAILVGLLVSVSFGIMGSLVVANKLTFMAGGISHSAYAGIGLAFFININPTIGAMVAGVVFALLIGIISNKNRNRSDAIIGVVWAGGMSIGIILIDLTPGYTADLMSWLFGSIISVSEIDLISALILDIIVVLSMILFYKEIHAISYDEEYAKITGVPVKWIYYYMLILTSLTVVILIRVIGLIMVIALLTIPALISEKFSHSLSKMMIGACVFGMIFVVGGFIIAYFLNITSSAIIILLSALAYAGSFIIQYIKKNIGKS
jgi:zinc transport system permease protein